VIAFLLTVAFIIWVALISISMTKNKELLNRIRDSKPFKVILSVTLEDTGEETIRQFEAVLKDLREIELARRLPGRPAFILFVAVKDEQAFDHFVGGKLRGLAGVSAIRSLLPKSGLRVYPSYPEAQTNSELPFGTIRRYYIT
jgi:DNA-binding Lrp family transcriptional regulator